MNWKVKLVLLFVKINKPLDPDSMEIGAMRKNSNAASRLGTKLFDKHVPVASVTDTDADGIPVRIYKNSDAPGQRVIVFYHGGGFVLYDLEAHDNVCRRLCAMNNAIVVSVNYRLAPEYTYPVAHDDSYRALLWTREHVDSYGGDPDNMVVVGDSAGGNLSACMAHRCKKDHIPLRAQVLIYPWVDGKLNNPSIDRNGEGYLLTKETMFWFQKKYTPRTEDRCVPGVSPCYEADQSGSAPAFVLTAEFDPLLDDGYKYAEQLKAAGNKVKYQEYKGLIHGFINLPGVAPEAMQAYNDIRDFLKEV